MRSEHAVGHRDRLLVAAAAREDEEAAPRADMAQPHLLPLALAGASGRRSRSAHGRPATCRCVGSIGFGLWAGRRCLGRRRPVSASAPRSMSTLPSQSTAASSTRPMRCASSAVKPRHDDLVAQHRKVRQRRRQFVGRRHRPRPARCRPGAPAGCSPACAVPGPSATRHAPAAAGRRSPSSPASGQPIRSMPSFSSFISVRQLHQEGLALRR